MTNMTTAQDIAAGFVAVKLAGQSASLIDLTFYHEAATVIAATKGLTARAVGLAMVKDHNESKGNVDTFAARISNMNGLLRTAAHYGVDFWEMVEDYNEVRADAGKDAMYSVQGLYNDLAMKRAPKVAKVEESADETDESTDENGENVAPSGDVVTSALTLYAAMSADERAFFHMGCAAIDDRANVAATV